VCVFVYALQVFAIHPPPHPHPYSQLCNSTRRCTNCCFSISLSYARLCVVEKTNSCVCMCTVCTVCVCGGGGGFLLSACLPASVCVFAHVYVCFSEHDLFLSDLQAVSLPLFLRLHSHSYPLFLSKLTLYMCLFLFHPMLVDRKRVPK
jgi:hypothetical protein